MKHRFKYAYYDLGEQRQGNVVVVRLGGPSANVLLLDPPNLARYRAGYRFSYIGGRYRSTAQLEIPHDGHWHVVLDLGGAPGHVRGAVSVLTPEAVGKAD